MIRHIKKLPIGSTNNYSSVLEYYEALFFSDA